MRIATYNVNGINGRLANLLGWLEEAGLAGEPGFRGDWIDRAQTPSKAHH